MFHLVVIRRIEKYADSARAPKRDLSLAEISSCPEWRLSSLVGSISDSLNAGSIHPVLVERVAQSCGLGRRLGFDVPLQHALLTRILHQLFHEAVVAQGHPSLVLDGGDGLQQGLAVVDQVGDGNSSRAAHPRAVDEHTPPVGAREINELVRTRELGPDVGVLLVLDRDLLVSHHPRVIRRVHLAHAPELHRVAACAIEDVIDVVLAKQLEVLSVGGRSEEDVGEDEGGLGGHAYTWVGRQDVLHLLQVHVVRLELVWVLRRIVVVDKILTLATIGQTWNEEG